MKAFAERCAAAIRSRTVGTVVVGNEAGDMDSVVGSLYLAYLLDRLSGGEDDAGAGATGPYSYRRPVCPLLHFPVVDLALRNDVLQTLQREAGICPQDLCACLLSEEEDVAKAKEFYAPLVTHPADGPTAEATGVVPPLTEADIVLFDHNKPSAVVPLARVVGVLDHHADERLFDAAAMASQGRLCVIAPAGSACTHLVWLFRQHSVDIPAPRLLFAPILLDTMNFDAALKKTTPADEAARDYLLGLPAFGQSADAGDEAAAPFHVKDMFDRLVALKFDIGGLTIPQTLRRDYKSFPFQWSDGTACVVGISSVLLLRRDVAALYGSRAIWVASVAAFAAKDRCDAFLVMFCAEDKTSGSTAMLRQLAVLGSESFQTAIAGFAAQHVAIGLTSSGDAAVPLAGLAYRDYDQRDYATSRKALTPLLGDFLRKASQ